MTKQTFGLVEQFREVIARRVEEAGTIGEHEDYAVTDRKQDDLETVLLHVERLLRAAGRLPVDSPLDGVADEVRAAIAKANGSAA